MALSYSGPDAHSGADAACGPNDWLIEELHQQFLANPRSVSVEWREVFENGAANGGQTAAPALPAPAPALPAPALALPAPALALPAPALPAPALALPALALPAPALPAPAIPAAEAPDEPGEPLRGVAARIAANMEASLSVPTATSFREVPAKLLEVNRTVLNNHLARVRRGKVSFTHLIGYAIIRAIAETVPALNNVFVEGSDGKPRIIRNEHVNLGLAVDQQKADGSRTLIVPVIKNADMMRFNEFVDAYEALIVKARDNKLTVDDMTGATVSLTNVGTLGTVQSVPRLMPGQGAIIGVGRIGYPTEFQAADPKVLARLGLSKIIAITSTYDHRIIQGAESGLFLKQVHEFLMGEKNFYADVFQDFGVPYEAVKWLPDHGALAEDDADSAMSKQMAVNTLINQYRVRGHLIANINPLEENETKHHPELDPASFGLTIWDLDREFLTGLRDGVYASVGGETRKMPLGDILGILRDAYSRTIGVEYMHIADPVEKRWIQEQVEGKPYHFTRDEQHHILERLSAAEALEKFLGARYVGQKRFGLEGAESAIPILDAIMSLAADSSLARVVMGMAHRGRLNVLVNIMGKRHEDLFREFEGMIRDDSIQGSGDVKYHLGFQGEHVSPSGNRIGIQLAPNPSHLEAVDPVVVGMARAFMDRIEDDSVPTYPILALLIHGDAAFAGQGVVTETLNLSQIKGYKVGGTVHLIINNQLGYTTAPHQSRTSEYSTDVAKSVQAPIFHVNADDPEACVHVARLAFAYQRRFHKDVVIDMIGYRRQGHNEGDDPSYTQPLMYRKIAARPSARTVFTQRLVDRGDITVSEAETALDYFQRMMQQGLDATRESAPPAGLLAKPSPPPIGVLPHVETGVSRALLDEVYAALSTVPEGFTVHPKLARQFEARDKMWASGEVDWALGEAFAFGTLLRQGTPVRLTGQDSRRGTFAHRHATLHDYETGDEFNPLSQLAGDGSHFWVYDSTLSEFAVLGFEYGYSLVRPEVLVAWEAQFGDFVNGAQVIIDQFLVAARDKWNENAGLVMLLPHGFEGQGPEHSSARLERFLILCADDNIQVANATTAAQFFHLLRRQMVRDVRSPLVVFAPKSGLRAKWSKSSVEQLTSGSFEEVLSFNDHLDSKRVRRIVLASGKVATEAEAYRDEIGSPVAVARIEQVYPWPFDAIADVVARYPNASELVWLQEEPENMGAWNAVKGNLFKAHDETHDILRVSRRESASPATGSAAVHQQEQIELMKLAFENQTD